MTGYYLYYPIGWDSDSTEQDMFTNSSPDDLNQSPLSPKYYLINDVI
jgi:hypothetical protein